MGILSKDNHSRKDTIEAAKGEEGETPREFKPRATIVDDGNGTRRLYMELEDPTKATTQSPHLDAILQRLEASRNN